MRGIGILKLTVPSALLASIPYRLMVGLLVTCFTISGIPGTALATSFQVPVLSHETASQSVQDSEYYSLSIASGMLERGEYAQALPYLTEALEKDPTNVLANFHMGNAYMGLSRQCDLPPQRAMFQQLSAQSFERVLDLNPNLTLTYFKLGKLALLRGDVEAARDYYQAGLRVDPGNAALMFNLARVYDQMGRRDEAIKHYRQTLALDSGFVFAYNNLGLLYEEAQDFDQAESYYKQSLRRDKGYNLPRLNLANLYAAQGRYDKAERLFIDALHQEPQNSWVYFYLGNMRLRQNDYQAAVDAYNKSVALNPSHPTTYYLLAISLTKLKRMDEAMQASLNYVKLAPDGEFAGEMKNLIFAAKFSQNNYVITGVAPKQ